MSSAVISYLHYLRDISRKIVGRTGFAQLIAPSSKKAESYVRQFFSLDHVLQSSYPDYEYFSEIIRYLEKHSDQKFFFGFGLFAGKYRTKKFSAPLFYLECDLERDTDTGRITIEPEYDTLRLNYDLLADVAGFEIFQEEDEIEVLGEKELEAFEKIEERVRTWFDHSEPDISALAIHAKLRWEKKIPTEPTSYFMGEFLQSYATEVFTFLQELLPGFKQVSIYHGGYRLDNEIAQKKKKTKGKALSIFEEKLSYVECLHGFTAPVPDVLSTYRALDELALSVDQTGIEGAAFSKLLSGVLTNKTIINNETEVPELKRTLGRIPFDLSPAQITGITNALTREISYIQGPPGTGKSHTISALICAGAIMGQKILFVSQKPAALQVVFDKLSETLTPEFAPHLPLYFDKNARPDLKAIAKKLLDTGLPLLKDDTIETNMRNRLGKAKAEFAELIEKKHFAEEHLQDKIRSEEHFLNLHDARVQHYRNLEQKYRLPLPALKQLKEVTAVQKLKHFITKMSEWEEKKEFNLVTELHRKKFVHQLSNEYHADASTAHHYGYHYITDWGKLLVHHTETETHHRLLKPDHHLLRFEIRQTEKRIKELQTEILRLKTALHLIDNLKDKENRKELEKWEKMLYWRKPAVIREKMNQIDYHKILNLFPIWACEIRYAGQIFPTHPEMFDLVVVDEASQVNLAEILPVFYRAKRICVVGDHAQLSLQSTGVNFKLSRRFDVLTWMHHKPAGKEYPYAKEARLTVTDASILDFLRSPHAGFSLPEVRLSAHYRSLPALANYTARYYNDPNNPFIVMTETPEKIRMPSFKVMEITGKRTKEKTVPQEAEEIIKIIEDITQKRFQLLPELKNFSVNKFSVGILSLIRAQCDLIEEVLNENFSEEVRQNLELMIGTPEEFQGNERDVMILSLALDSEQRYSRGHYENPNRWNVATSRAKLLTIAVHAGIPENFEGLKSWIRHFKQYQEDNAILTQSKKDHLHDLEQSITQILEKAFVNLPDEWKLTSLAQACGQKELRFVLLNQTQGTSFLLETDGLFFDKKSMMTKNSQKQRLNTLTRAGWKVVVTQAHVWFDKGDLRDFDDPIIRQELDRIFGIGN